MLTYLDRHGNEIDRATWHDLYRDPAYTLLARTAESGVVVETSWVGVWCPSHEPVPRPFLVRVCREGGSRSCPLYEAWELTEETAIAAHLVAVGEYLGVRECEGM
jgi:hypothetical protein